MKIDKKGLVFLRLLINGIPIDNEASIKKMLLDNGFELKRVDNEQDKKISKG